MDKPAISDSTHVQFVDFFYVLYYENFCTLLKQNILLFLNHVYLNLELKNLSYKYELLVRRILQTFILL